MILHVTDAKYVDGYRVALTFNDGVKKVVDLKDQLWGEMFEPLNDIENFKRFHISPLTIEWYNGADFAPEFLYNA